MEATSSLEDLDPADVSGCDIDPVLDYQERRAARLIRQVQHAASAGVSLAQLALRVHADPLTGLTMVFAEMERHKILMEAGLLQMRNKRPL